MNPPLLPATNPLARARELVAENREAEAAALLEQAPSPATDALHREIALRAATTALQASEIAAAVAWLDRGLARNPADPDLAFFRANLHLDAGHAPLAVEFLRRCVAADPRREAFAVGLAKALLAAGTPADIPSMLSGFAESGQAQLARGEALERMGDTAAARAAYERAGRLRPDLSEVWLNLAHLCEKNGDKLAALATFTRALALRPQSARPHFECGRILAQLGDAPAAAAAFEQCLRLAPDHAEARRQLALVRQAPRGNTV